VPDASPLLLFVGASVALLAVPGPAVLYVVTLSLDQGRTAGLVSVLGVETGTFAYALAAAAGLTPAREAQRGRLHRSWDQRGARGHEPVAPVSGLTGDRLVPVERAAAW